MGGRQKLKIEEDAIPVNFALDWSITLFGAQRLP